MLSRFVELIANLGVRLDISHYNCILKVRSFSLHLAQFPLNMMFHRFITRTGIK